MVNNWSNIILISCCIKLHLFLQHLTTLFYFISISCTSYLCLINCCTFLYLTFYVSSHHFNKKIVFLASCTVLYNVQYSTVQNIYPNIYNAELAQPIYLNTYLAYLVILVVVWVVYIPCTFTFTLRNLYFLYLSELFIYLVPKHYLTLLPCT